MKTILVAGSIIFCFFFWQCNSNDHIDNSIGTTIKVNLSKEIKNIHEQNLIKDCRLVQLQTLEEVLIGEINQAIWYDKYIYVADYYKSKAVFVFDTMGRYLNKIDNYGRAGEEYLQLRSMWIDTLKQTLNFISRIDKKLFVYDLCGKHLLKINKLPKSFSEMVSNLGLKIGYSENYIEDKTEPYNLWVLDSNNNIVNKFLKIDPKWDSNGFKDGEALSLFNEKIYYIEPMDFHVKLIRSDQKISCPYYFDFGEYKWPDKKVDYDERKELLKNGRDYVNRIYRFQETNDFLLAQIVFKGKNQCVVYNKSTGKVSVCNLEPYEEKYFIPFGEIISMDKNYMITSLRAEQVKRCCEGDKFNDFEKQYPEQIHKMKSLFPNINESDNPFLVIYTL